MGKTTWTDEEVDLLKEHYGEMSSDALHNKHLPDKSLWAIACKANRLGLYKNYLWDTYIGYRLVLDTEATDMMIDYFQA